MENTSDVATISTNLIFEEREEGLPLYTSTALSGLDFNFKSSVLHDINDLKNIVRKIGSKVHFL